ncbi:hypothetical protein D3C83_242340 [compost metagenome]
MIHVERRLAGGLLQQFAELANFTVSVGEQTGDLSLKRARIHNLAERCVGRERE